MIRYVHTRGHSNGQLSDLSGPEFHSRDSVRHSGTGGHRSWSERDRSHAHYHQQGPSPGPPQGTRLSQWYLSEALCDISVISLSFTSQAILCDVPRLQYIIVVDSKRTSWTDMPRGILIYNMDTVKDLGSKPDNSKWAWLKRFSFSAGNENAPHRGLIQSWSNN